MARPVDLMIFDLDGTLVTSGEDLVACINRTLHHFGLPPRPYAEVIQFIGDGVRRLIERSLGDGAQDLFDEALSYFSADYTHHMLDSTVLYEGIPEVLNHFNKKTKIIITNKRHYYTKLITDALDASRHFVEIIGADTTAFIKPDARLVYPLLERYGADPRRTVMIGDGPNDILLARHAGLLSCAFLNGLGEREMLLDLKPDLTYETPLDLIDLFC